jgi:hypothetical protein
MNYLLLAVGEPLPLPGRMGSTMRDGLIVTGAILLVAAGLILWAVAVRKRHRRHSAPHRPHYSHHSGVQSAEEEGDESRHSSHSRRRRRRRREHLPRNPTLAETGGLPPKRSEIPARPPQNPPPT